MPSRRHRRKSRSTEAIPDRSEPGSTAADHPGSGSRLRRLLASPVAIALAAISALVTALIVGVGQELFPKENLADRLRAGDAISVTIVTEVPQAGVPGAAARERLDSPSSEKAVEAIRPPFPERVGKVELIPASSAQMVHLQLTGQRSLPVDVVGMRIRVLRRQPPLTGTLLLGPGPQGSNPNIVLRATVDDPAPKLTEVNGDTVVQQPYFASHHISLSRGETVPIALSTEAVHGYCEWDIAIEYIADGKSAVMYVGRNGIVHGDRDDRPFAVSALPPRMGDYGVVYTFPAYSTGDVYYRRISPDQYCSAVSTFYGRDSALGKWAC